MPRTLFGETSATAFEDLQDQIDVLKTDLDGFPDRLKYLTTGEINQVENINTSTISPTQWGYVSILDQDVNTTASPTFNVLNCNTVRVLVGGFRVDLFAPVLTSNKSIQIRDITGTMMLLGDIPELTAINALTNAELTQLANIGTSTISSVQWGYLSALNQDLATTSAPSWTSVYLSNGSFTTRLQSGTLSGSRVITFQDANGTVAHLSDLPSIPELGAINALTNAELTQLANINATVISTTQWGYLGALNQALNTTASPTFVTGNFTTVQTTTCRTGTLNPLAASPSFITFNTNLRRLHDTGGTGAANGLAFNTTLFTTMPTASTTVGNNSIRGYNGGFGGSRGYLDIGAGGTSQFCGIAFNGWMPGGDDDANINTMKFFTSGTERMRLTDTELYSSLGSLRLEGIILNDRTILIDNDAINLSPSNVMTPGEIRATLVPGSDSGTLILGAGGLNSVLNWTGIICNNDSSTPANCGIRFFVKGVEKMALSNTGLYNIVLLRSTTLTSRPAYSAVALENEIRANYIAANSDGGHLRLSTGGGTLTSSASYIDIFAYSSTPDINQNIAFNIAGQEVARWTGTKQTLNNLDVSGDIKVQGSLSATSANLDIVAPSGFVVNLTYNATTWQRITSIGTELDVINELTLNSGVTIDGVLLKDGLTDGVDVSVFKSDYDGKINQDVRTSATPTFVGITFGESTLNRYKTASTSVNWFSNIFPTIKPTGTMDHTRVGNITTLSMRGWTGSYNLSGSPDKIVSDTAVPTEFRPREDYHGFMHAFEDGLNHRTGLVVVKANGIVELYQDVAYTNWSLGLGTFQAFHWAVSYPS